MISVYPSYSQKSGWNELLPYREIQDIPPHHKQFKYIVIGAGFTGLSIARQLALNSPEATILLIDALTIGEGSSGRNSGFMSSFSVKHQLTTSSKTIQKQVNVYDEGLRHLKRFLDEHHINVDWCEAGKYTAAATQRGTKTVKASYEKELALDRFCLELSPHELKQRLGTDYYRYGAFSPYCVLVQPAAMQRGMADHLPENVVLLENTPVTAIMGKATDFTVKTSKGNFKAHTLAIANNAFAKSLGFLNDKMITIYTYAALTPALPDSEAALLGDQAQWGVLPAHRLGTTLRKVKGNRFMVRSSYSYEKPRTINSVTAELKQLYKNRYPQMKNHDFEYTWGGTTALTRNGGVFFGQLKEGVFGALGCNGSGVLRGTVHGRLLADLMSNKKSEALALVQLLEQPSWMPPEPFRKIGAKSLIALNNVFAGKEK